MAKWFKNLIPFKILHNSTIDLQEQKLKKQEEIAVTLKEDVKELKDDKKYWRDAYFQRNPRKPTTK